MQGMGHRDILESLGSGNLDDNLGGLGAYGIAAALDRMALLSPPLNLCGGHNCYRKTLALLQSVLMRTGPERDFREKRG